MLITQEDLPNVHLDPSLRPQIARHPARMRPGVAAVQANPLPLKTKLHLFPVYFAVDAGNLLDPLAPVGMFQLHHLAQGPMKVIGNEGYLLLELIEGVAYDPPTPARSSSKTCAHCGQVTVGPSRESRLISL